MLLSLGTTVGLAGYFRGLAASDATAKSGASAGATTPAGTAAPSASSGGTAGTTAAATTGGTAAGSVLAGGTYTGDVATNRWGPVQVQITVAGGSISDVAVLEVPSGNSKDVTINNRAVPVLVQSTLAAQSAQIDSVSGATYTSTSYKQSLQSAIDAARAAASN